MAMATVSKQASAQDRTKPPSPLAGACTTPCQFRRFRPPHNQGGKYNLKTDTYWDKNDAKRKKSKDATAGPEEEGER